MRAKYHDHSSHTRQQQMPRSHRHSHRHKNKETNCRGLLATTVEQLHTRSRRALLAITGSPRGRHREACRLKLVHAVRGLVEDKRLDIRRESTVLFSKSYSVATRDARCFDAQSFIPYHFERLLRSLMSQGSLTLLLLVLSLLTAGHRRIKPPQHFLVSRRTSYKCFSMFLGGSEHQELLEHSFNKSVSFLSCANVCNCVATCSPCFGFCFII